MIRRSLWMLLAALTFLFTFPLTGQAQGGDIYEPDDVTPGPINPGESQDRTFDPNGDVDRVTFTLVTGQAYSSTPPL